MRIDPSLISGTHARQIISLGDGSLTKLLEQVWGVIDRSDAQKQQAIDEWHGKLDGALANADLSNGRALFQKTCATCHKLYGEGGQIGPDLTGSNRNNLGYLLENASKYAPPGGGIDIYGWREGDRATLAVTDDGPGIPADWRERIFEPFVRLDDSPRGAGIGLFAARHLARTMGGELSVEPREPYGTQFVLRLGFVGPSG